MAIHDLSHYLIDLMKLVNLNNILVFGHEKDRYETPATLKFLSDLSSINFVDISNSGCAGKLTLGKGHGIAVTKCFAEYEAKNKKNQIRL